MRYITKIELQMTTIIMLILSISSTKVLCEKNIPNLLAEESRKDNQNLTTQERNGRNILLEQRPWLYSLSEDTPCLTNSGVIGRCISYKTCYEYVKHSDRNICNSLFLSRFVQCSYFNSKGQQGLGICFTESENPDLSQPIEQQSYNNIYGDPNHIERIHFESILHPLSHFGVSTKSKIKAVYLQWPPPIPTHPPNHAAPTHPPFLIDRTTGSTWQTTKNTWQSSTKKESWQTATTKVPLQTSSIRPSWQTTTKKVSWPTTTRMWTTTTRFPWPPPIPTHPPSHLTTKPTSLPSSNEISYEDEPIATIISCGTKNGRLNDQERIVGGQNASPNEWPWIVVMFNNGRQFCGGSIIDNTHILTAAHCVSQMTAYDVARITVHLGDHDIRNTNEVQHVVRKVKRVVRHKGFDFSHLHNDVAVLTMDQPVLFSNNIRPICLPTASSAKTYRGKLATVAGWGSLRENGPQPSVLQKVTIPIWSNMDCSRKYGSAAPAGIADSMICAGQTAKDSCSGDSGGPMMVNEGGERWTQVGIVSWGIGCGKGQYPGVYSRVTSFLPWIAKNLH